ncbi:MAG: beta strand repeat-containing protein, partial [Candidatus Doudnabacteria bacterium]
TSLTTDAWTGTNSGAAYTLVGGTRLSVLGNGNVGIARTAPTEKLDVLGSTVSSQMGFTVNSVTDGAQIFTSEGSTYGNGRAGVVGSGGPSHAIKVNPLGRAFGSAGVVGSSYDNTGGGRHDVGVYGYTLYDSVGANSIDSPIGGLFMTETTTANTSFNGTAYGVYASSDLSAATSLGTASVYGVYGTAVGKTNATVYGGYFSGSGGTTNYGVYSNAGTNYFSGSTGIGTTTPTTFKLEVAGNIGPEADNTRDLGSPARRFANVYATNVNIASLTQGSVLFAGASGVISQDNTNLFFDDTNNTIGIGTTRTGAISGTNARLLVKGSGATSATSSLDVQDSGGNSKFFVRDDGNVGVGTNAPSKTLDVRGTQAEIILTSTTGTNRSSIIFDNTGVGSTILGTEKSTGGDILTGSTAYAGVLGTSGALPLQFGTNNTVNMTIASGGNVGIGTSSPSTKLTIENDSTTAYANAVPTVSDTGIHLLNTTATTLVQTGIQFNLTGDAQNRIAYIGAIKESAANRKTSLVFATDNGTTRPEIMRITGDGNVGIGTTNPTGKLHVQEEGGSDAIILSETASGLTSFAVLQSSTMATSNDGGIIKLLDGTGTQKIHLDARSNQVSYINAGNFGIGTTSPSTPLVVRDLVSAYDRNVITWERAVDGAVAGTLGTGKGGVNNVYLGSTTNHDLLFETNNTTKMTIQAGGNVGIGTTSPTSVFHVVGSQPAISAGAGTNATQVVQITGGKGGDTSSGAGAVAGIGAAANITGGAGGDAPAGSTNGTGGTVTIQGGAPGSGLGAAGSYGNLVLQALGGNVGIGVTPSNFKLEIAGHVGPSVDNTYDLGSGTYRFRKGYFGSDVTVGGSLTIQGALATVSNGQVLITGTPTGTAINQGSVYMNPPTAGTNNVLLGIAVNGTEKARIDAEGDMQIVGAFSSGSTTGTNQLSGNLSVLGNTTLGDATSDTLTVTARVSSSLNPSADNTYDLGTASLRWANFYATNATFNAISTVGTSDADFVINSDNATADTEDATLQFERGTLTPNAIIKWDSTNDRFEFNNFPVKMLSDLTVAGTGTSSIAGLLQIAGTPAGTGIGQGSLYINPASATTNYTLFGVGVAGVERFKIDAEGDTTIQASLGIENAIYDITQDTLTVDDKLQINGNGIKDSTGTERITLGATNTITGAVNNVGNVTLIKTNTATAVTQYPSYDLIFQGSGWNTTGAAESVLTQSFRNIAGSGASGSVPYRLGVLNNGGTEYVSFDGLNQRVGIGTTTPGEKLTVTGNAQITTQLGVGGAPNSTRGIDITQSFAPAVATGAYGVRASITRTTASNALSGVMSFYSSPTINAPALTVDNVSHFVASNATITAGTLTNQYGLYVADLSGATNNYSIYTGTAKSYFGGNVGIGTTNPSASLQIGSGAGLKDLWFVNSSATIKMGVAGGGSDILSTSAAGDFAITNYTGTRDILFGSGTSEKVRITASGNVGIGTTSPTANLQVAQGTSGAGTVSTTATLTTVTGVGTQFLNTFKVGDTITVNAETRTISAIASNTSLTTDAWTGTNSGAAYTLVGGTRLSVLGNGNVGIGTTTPDNILNLRRDQNAQTLLTVYNATSNTAAAAGILVGVSGSGGNYGYLEHFPTGYTSSGPSQADTTLLAAGYAGDLVIASGGSSSSRNIQFWTSGGAAQAERMRIDSAGNVGIGTTAPAEKLEVKDGKIYLSDTDITQPLTAQVPANVYGALRPSSGTTGGLDIIGVTDADAQTPLNFRAYFGTTNPTDTTAAMVFQAGKQATTDYTALADTETAFQWLNGGNVRMTMLGSGNVGIGTTAPSEKLDIAGGSILLDSLQSLKFGTGLSSVSEYAPNQLRLSGYSGVDMYAAISTSDFTFTNNQTPNLMIIKGTGNVGIGTTAPEQKLHVAGNILSKYGVGSITTFPTETGLSVIADTSPRLVLARNTGSLTNGVIDFGGISAGSFVYGGRIQNYSGAFSFYTQTPSTTEMTVPKMVIDTSGNVGIGTTAPARQLEVYGSTGIARITGSAVGAPARRAILELVSADTSRAQGILTIDGSTENWFMGEPYAANGFTIGYGASQAEYVAQSKLYINSSGNVGIGTTSPSATLTVSPQTQSGTPALNGSATRIITNTFTDNATLASGTATNYVSNSTEAPT